MEGGFKKLPGGEEVCCSCEAMCYCVGLVFWEVGGEEGSILSSPLTEHSHIQGLLDLWDLLTELRGMVSRLLRTWMEIAWYHSYITGLRERRHLDEDDGINNSNSCLPCTSRVLFHLNLPATLWNRCSYCPPVTVEEANSSLNCSVV